MSPRIAVVIPLYNHAEYVGRAIQSALEQTRPPDSVIVVDDGSTDGSVEAAQAIRDSRIRLETGPNRGAHLALQRGVELAEGHDFVAVLNSDDRFLPDRLARCEAHLTARPRSALLCTRLHLIDATDRPLADSEPRARWFSAVWSLADSELSLPERLGIANFAGTTSNFFAHREWLVRHPFAPYRYVHDYAALVIAAVRDELAVLDEDLLAYRVHPANTISTEPARLTRELLRMNLDLARQLAPDLERDSALRARWADYLRCAWSNVSAFRADLFQTLIARALGDLPEERVAALSASLSVERFPELAEYPNRALVNAHAGLVPLGPTSGLAAKHAELLKERARLREERALWERLVRVQAVVARSRWLAAGRLSGAERRLFDPGPSDPAARLASIRARLDASPWARLGGFFRSRSLRRLRELLSTDPS